MLALKIVSSGTSTFLLFVHYAETWGTVWTGLTVATLVVVLVILHDIRVEKEKEARVV